jgi:hypothetical protein
MRPGAGSDDAYLWIVAARPLAVATAIEPDAQTDERVVRSAVMSMVVSA